MFCLKCEKEFERKKFFYNNIIEEYNNVYGTRCPYCNSLIKPIEEHNVGSENIGKIEKLKQIMLNKIENKLKGK